MVLGDVVNVDRVEARAHGAALAVAHLGNAVIQRHLFAATDDNCAAAGNEIVDGGALSEAHRATVVKRSAVGGGWAVRGVHGCGW